MPNNLVPPQSGAVPAGGAAQQAQKQVRLQDVKEMILKQSTVDRALKNILKHGGPIKPKEVLDMASQLVGSRTVSAQQAAGYLSDLPDDPNKVREWCERHAREAESVLDQLLEMVQGVEPPPGGAPDQQQAPPGLDPSQMMQQEPSNGGGFGGQ